MEEFVNQLVAKTGIDSATAQKVVGFVRDNWDDVVKWIGAEKLGGLKDEVSGAMEGMKDKLGGMFSR